MMPDGGPSSMTTTTATTSPSTTSTAASSSSSSAASLLTSSASIAGSSSSDSTELLTTCLSTIITYDYDYALCVMNSGFFELDSSPFRTTTTAISSLLSGSSGSSSVDSGSCTLLCTKPTLSASSSCCSAASTVMNCPQSSSSIDYCKSVIEDTVAESQQCGLSSQNTALIVCVAIIAAFFTAVMIAARIYAKKQAAALEGDALESRFAVASRATWEATLAAWRQVTNLIWKNLIIRRRKPVSFVFELFLPVVLTLALVFIANLDTLFDTGDEFSSSPEAASLSETILCTGLDSLEFTDYGALSTNMSTFYSSGQSVIGLFLLISYIKFVSTTTTTMVIEKETRIREVMKIMGLSNFTLLSSWCLTTAILATPLAFAIAAELKYGQVFPMTEYATLVFLFWALSLSIVSFSYFITPFFNKSRAASIASVLLWLVLFFPFFSVMSKSNSSKYLGALAPPTAFALGIDDLVRRAQLGRGMAYAMGLIESPITVPSAFAMSWFLILDSFILVVLGWYFDNVLPQEFGVRKPWNFLFVKEYWLPSTRNNKDVVVLESPSTDSSPQTHYSFGSPRGVRLLHQTSSDGSIVMMKDRPGLVASVEPYGVSVTTLEEVFLRISQDREEEAAMGVAACGVEAVDQIRKTSATSANSRGTLTGPNWAPISSEVTNRATFWSQYSALLTKRVRIAKRDKKNLLNAVCIPLLFLIILVSLPEIDVASFMTTSDYATEFASTSRQGRCSSANFSLVSVPSACDSFSFNYCDLGVIDCSASTCCDKTNVESPYYACNMCDGTSSSSPVTPCYNKDCLDQDGAKLQATLNAFLTSVVVMLAFAFVPAAIVAFIVREKNPNQNAKSLQLICGANVSAYWLSTWTHDIVIMMVTVIAAMVMVPLSDRTLKSSMEVWGVVCLVGSHALAVIPMAYLFSFKFKKHAVAQTSLLVFALCTGGLLSIFSFLCRLIDFDLTPGNSSDNLTLSSLDRNYLRWIFLLFPGYSLNNGIYEIATRKLSRSALYGSNTDTIAPPSFFGAWEGLGTDYTCTSCWDAMSGETCCVRNVFDLDVAGAPVAYAVVEIVIFMLLVFIVETRSLSWRSDKRPQQFSSNEDDDVAKERQKVESAYPTQDDSVFIRNLRQQYGGRGGKVALDSLCLSIAKGECFGYLGINGAGNCAGISQDQVTTLCSSLGVPNRANEIMNGEGNGSVLTSYLETSGVIPIDVFCSWWLTESMGSALQEFFQSKFQDCQLVEHQGGHFRFQVPKHSLRPYAIFGLLEENKEQLHVSEYGVSETSLEHIFNTMAAQQGEEQLLGSARYRGP
ncbi:hypothetical protein PC111_g16700 [Phytophthora cactorum]|nr:hypothetical protein PC111_g16700 [Phytophthora cactorum]